MARDGRGEVREAAAGETATLFSSPFLAPHAPSTTSGIDEIDCGGCISKRGPTWGSSPRGGGDGMLYSPPCPSAPSLAAKTQRGEKTLLLAVTLARVPTTFSTSPVSGFLNPRSCSRRLRTHPRDPPARVTQPRGMNGRIERM